MKLYNTRTRQVEELKPQQPPRVTVYTCGPTVYDYPHIGNWFTFVRYDLLIRSLRLAGHTPEWVMNITDVGHLVGDADEGEDKLQKGARREGKTAWDVAEFYSNYFVNGLRRLTILTPDHLPKATEHIPEQIALVQTLADKGYTYTIDDGVYFDTAAFPNYAAFAQLDLDEQQAGARVSYNQQKRNVADFALWKFSPLGDTPQRDMEWDSPFTDPQGRQRKGFPGWHLECSAMGMKYLGNTIDIHSGGIDHVPVHHTNEIAQSEAATGQRLANYWMHTNHITIEGEKVSKSLGNGITLEDIEERGYSLDVLRLHILESHYRSQSKFSWESLEAARNRLKGFYAAAALRWQPVQPANADTAQAYDFNAAFQADVATPLSHDLDTPQVLFKLNERFTDLSKQALYANNISGYKAYLEAVDAALGTHLMDVADITEEQKQLVAKRQAARVAKDWAESDRIRDELAGQKIGVRDTAEGIIWFPL